MSRRICVLAAAAFALASPAAAQAQDTAPAQDKAPWGALVDEAKAGEIVLRDVCLPGILENKPIADLALQKRLVAMPARSVRSTGPNDKVFRLGSLRHVNAVAWADGSCSVYVDTGAADKLKAMAEAVILARPERFARGVSEVADGGRVERVVYCAMAGDERLVATITSPHGKAAYGTRALSSTVYRARGPSRLCAPG